MAEYQLEIHHIDVGGGDCTAVTVKDLSSGIYCCKVLIDGGGMGKGMSRMVAYLKAYIYPQCKVLKEDKEKSTIDYDEEWDMIIASHYHDDHVKGLTQTLPDGGGYVFTAKVVIDIGKKGETKLESGMVIYEENSTTPGYLKKYHEWVKEAAGKRVIPIFLLEDSYEDAGEGKGRKLKDNLPYSNTVTLKDGNNPTGIEMICVMANGVLPDGTNLLKPQKDNKKRAINPNDQSIAWIIRWKDKDFYYFTAGDLSGDLNQTSYYTLEPQLVKYILDQKLLGDKAALTAQKITHHGSEHSSFPASKLSKAGWLDTLKPLTLILTANQKKGVPNADFLENRLLKYTKEISTDAKLQFVNNMFYQKSHPAYTGLSDLEKESGNNGANLEKVTIKSRTGVITNGSPGGIVIVLDGSQKFKSFPKTSVDEVSPHKLSITGKGHGGIIQYQVWSMAQAGDVVDLVSERASSKLQIAISDTMVNYVLQNQDFWFNDDRKFGGIPGQAEAFIEWLKLDKKFGQEEARQYLLDNFPLVYKAVDFDADLSNPSQAKEKYIKVMTDLFKQYFILQKKTYLFKEGEISDDEEKTLVSILYSPFQAVILFNNVVYKSGVNEPYRTMANIYMFSTPYTGNGVFDPNDGYWLKIRHAALSNILNYPDNQVDLKEVKYSEGSSKDKDRAPESEVTTFSKKLKEMKK